MDLHESGWEALGVFDSERLFFGSCMEERNAGSKKSWDYCDYEIVNEVVLHEFGYDGRAANEPDISGFGLQGFHEILGAAGDKNYIALIRLLLMSEDIAIHVLVREFRKS